MGSLLVGSSILEYRKLFITHVVIVAFAGLWYLSVFLCHRFGVFFPSLASSRQRNITHAQSHEGNEPLLSNDLDPNVHSASQQSKELATFPVYMLLIPYIPLGIAIFIAGTRYFDFRNHGFDVLAGAAIGSVTAYVGFRMFHSSL